MVTNTLIDIQSLKDSVTDSHTFVAEGNHNVDKFQCSVPITVDCNAV